MAFGKQSGDRRGRRSPYGFGLPITVDPLCIPRTIGFRT